MRPGKFDHTLSLEPMLSLHRLQSQKDRTCSDCTFMIDLHAAGDKGDSGILDVEVPDNLETVQTGNMVQPVPCNEISDEVHANELLTPCAEPAPEPATDFRIEEPFYLSSDVEESPRAAAEVGSSASRRNKVPKEAHRSKNKLELNEAPEQVTSAGEDTLTGQEASCLCKLLEELMEPDEPAADQVPDCIFWQNRHRHTAQGSMSFTG